MSVAGLRPWHVIAALWVGVTVGLLRRRPVSPTVLKVVRSELEDSPSSLS